MATGVRWHSLPSGGGWRNASPKFPQLAKIAGPRIALQTDSDGGASENAAVDLARVAWLTTVLACLLAVIILLLNGYLGYAGVTFAVMLSAAINLT